MVGLSFHIFGGNSAGFSDVFHYNRVSVIAGFHCSCLDALNLKLVLHPNKTCFAVLLLTMKISYLQ